MKFRKNRTAHDSNHGGNGLLGQKLSVSRVHAGAAKTVVAFGTVILVLVLSLAMRARARTPVIFVDVTQESGVHFTNSNAPTADKFLIETMTGGAAVFDYDNDGWLDIFLVNGASLRPHQTSDHVDKSAPEYWNRLYRNNHNGTFTDVTVRAGLKGSGYGMGVTTGDYDNDGYMDLLVTSYGGATLYHNNGNGTFTDVTEKAGLHTGGWTTSAAFFDYDNDGRLDLFICRYVDWNFSKNPYCDVNGSNERAYCHPKVFRPITNYLFHNNGDGTFSDVSVKSRIAESAGKALGVAIADFNNDGFTDVAVANDSYPQSLFINNGDGTFTESALMAGVAYNDDGQVYADMGIDAADVDDDGFPDIVTTALSHEAYGYFHNNGDGTFTSLSADSGLIEFTRLLGGWGVRIFDYDNDGHKDLFFLNSHVMDNITLSQPDLRYRQPPLLLRQVGKRFADVSSVSGEVFKKLWPSRGAAFGDLDNDGDIDVVVSTCGGPAHLLRNEGGSQNAWVAFELRGTKSNRDGIGAKVILTLTSGKVEYAFVSTAGSYLSANDKRAYFGLGGESSVRQVEIIWPSGIRQVVHEPPIREMVHITERQE